MLETPFKLTDGINVTIPMEIDEPSIRWSMFNAANNSESLAVELHLAEEVRSEARVQKKPVNEE